MSKIPFDVKFKPQIESGEYTLETRDGNRARIICWDREDNDNQPLVALVKKRCCEVVIYTKINGEYLGTYGHGYDLFIVTPEEELTEFEQEVSDIVEYCKKNGENVADGYAKRHAKSLLSLAREQFIKDGYIIEKKSFHDAVENISDKHLAEMSVQYSLHCKIEDGTRHAIMNWDTFQKVAQKFIDIGKAEALKDLPRWRRYSDSNNRGYGIHAGLLLNGDWLIELKDLEKLPKEDEK